MSGPDITATEIEAVTRVLQTPYLNLGPRTIVQGSHGAGERRSKGAIPQIRNPQSPIRVICEICGSVSAA